MEQRQSLYKSETNVYQYAFENIILRKFNIFYKIMSITNGVDTSGRSGKMSHLNFHLVLTLIWNERLVGTSNIKNYENI